MTSLTESTAVIGGTAWLLKIKENLMHLVKGRHWTRPDVEQYRYRDLLAIKQQQIEWKSFEDKHTDVVDFMMKLAKSRGPLEGAASTIELVDRNTGSTDEGIGGIWWILFIEVYRTHLHQWYKLYLNDSPSHLDSWSVVNDRYVIQCLVIKAPRILSYIKHLVVL